MRNVYTDAGNDPFYSVLAKHKIDGAFFDCRETRLNDVYLSAVRSKLSAVGVYVVDNWPEIKNLTGKQAAEWMDARVKGIQGIISKPDFPKVQFDLERHDPDWILACLTRWRELRPKQDTSWTMEPMQGGWMTPAFVASVVALKVRIAPQLYDGPMTKQFDSLANARDLTKRGFPDALISPIWDAAHLPEYWSGWAFSQGRLPQ